MEGCMRDYIIRYFPLADRGLSPQAKSSLVVALGPATATPFHACPVGKVRDSTHLLACLLACLRVCLACETRY
jgi:hypothetical protein